MMHPRLLLISRFLIVCFDYGVIGLLAIVGSMAWMAVRLGFDPDSLRVVRDYPNLVLAWTGLVAVFLGLWAWRRPWFAARRHWWVLMEAGVFALGGLAWLRMRALVLGLEVSGFAGADGATHQLIIEGGVFLFFLCVLFAARRRAMARGWLSAPVRTVLAVGLAGYGFYLTRDEAPAPSIVRNRAVTAGRCEDEASYRLTLRYTPGPGGGGKQFTAPSRDLRFEGEKNKRRAYLLAHREEIEANWAELAEVRAWWGELAAEPRLGEGNRVDGKFEQPFIRFQPVRAYMQHALAIAGLRAIDGDGDGALAMVGAVYVVGARLEPGSQTLVRLMIARVVQGEALKAAEFVLDQASVSTEAKARFARQLTEPPGGGAEAARLVLVDTTSFFQTAEGIATFADFSTRMPHEPWLRYLARNANALMLSFTLNPQATCNRLNDYEEKIARLAAARDLAGITAMEARMDAELAGGFEMKNLSGRLLLPMMMPASSILVRSYWETEDRRAALVARLDGASVK